jgi:hypothetical protein
VPLATTNAFSKAPIRVADLDSNGRPDAVAIAAGKQQILLNKAKSRCKELGQGEAEGRRNRTQRHQGVAR